MARAIDFAGGGLDVEYLTQFYAFMISCFALKKLKCGFAFQKKHFL